MIELLRDTPAIEIPAGTRVDLKQGSPVWITQVLGGMFTVETEFGYLARIDGKDADALGQPVPEERLIVQNATGKTNEELVWDQLRTCYDPEIPVNIVELGLIYSCKIDGDKVEIQMTLTAPGCGMGEILKQDIEIKLKEISGIGEVQVNLVFDPPWDRAMMSEAARLQLGML